MIRQLILVIFIFTTFWGCTKIERITKITTDDIVISNSSVAIGGSIIDQSNEGIDSYGHCWAISVNPTLGDEFTYNVQAITETSFSSELLGIAYNTTYYIRTYALSGDVVSYGEEKTFSISDLSATSVSCTNPIIQTESSFTVSSSISGINSLSVMDYGFCWAETPSPTINDFVDAKGVLPSDITHSSTINNLSQQVIYYIRAYVKLDNNTIIYSDEKSIEITDLELTTNNNFITGNSALLTGTILGLGVLPLIDHGHCWSITSSTPNFNDNVNSLGPISVLGNFDSQINNLNSGTTYYYSSYAIKSDNSITYGGVKSFTF